MRWMHDSSPHSFDWKGLTYATKLGAICVLFCFMLQYSVPYAVAYTQPRPTPIAVVSAPLIQSAAAETVSTSTPVRVISTLTIADVVPPTGKFIAADLVNMRLYLYQDGTTTAEYQILSKGRPGTPYETPGGYYAILTKETDHYNAQEGVHMPYSMEFYGNYFIHGWPTYDDGTPVDSSYSGGCIRLSTADAEKVYDFANVRTPVFVYDTGEATSAPPVALAGTRVPAVSADAYLVADLDNGAVYAEKDPEVERPIASLTKLMTALVANETIMFNDDITISRGDLLTPSGPNATDTTPETLVVGDALYPLLMESNNHVADTLAQYYGTGAFVSWMNTEARALDMASTAFVDPTGISRDDVSTPDDLYRLAVYLADKKSFVWSITRTPQKTITAVNRSSYSFGNFNEFSGDSSFIGGKVGQTEAAKDTMVSVFSIPVDGQYRRIAIIVLGSDNDKSDEQRLRDWFIETAHSAQNTACASCAVPSYPTIPL